MSSQDHEPTSSPIEHEEDLFAHAFTALQEGVPVGEILLGQLHGPKASTNDLSWTRPIADAFLRHKDPRRRVEELHQQAQGTVGEVHPDLDPKDLIKKLKAYTKKLSNLVDMARRAKVDISDLEEGIKATVNEASTAYVSLVCDNIKNRAFAAMNPDTNHHFVECELDLAFAVYDRISQFVEEMGGLNPDTARSMTQATTAIQTAYDWNHTGRWVSPTSNVDVDNK